MHLEARRWKIYIYSSS